MSFFDAWLEMHSCQRLLSIDRENRWQRERPRLRARVHNVQRQCQRASRCAAIFGAPRCTCNVFRAEVGMTHALRCRYMDHIYLAKYKSFWPPTSSSISIGSFKSSLEVRIRLLEDFATEERQHFLPCLPAHDPRFLQPPIYLCNKIL